MGAPLSFTLSQERQAWVLEHRPVVLQEVHNWAKRYPPIECQMDDVIQEGMIALMYAARTFNPARHVPFSAYARERVSAWIKTLTYRMGVVSVSPHMPWAAALRLAETDDMPHEGLHDGDAWAVDCHLIASRLISDLTSRCRGGARDVRIFMRVRFRGDDLRNVANDYGCSYETVRLRVERTEKTFNAWAEEIRAEVATI